MSDIVRRLQHLEHSVRPIPRAAIVEAAAEIEQLRALNAELVAALELTVSMFLDLERGIAPSRADFEKARAALVKARGQA